MKVIDQRVCPSCAFSQADVEIESFPPAETLSIDALEKQWLELERGEVFFTYSRCQSCQLLYAPRFFSGEILNKLYESMPDNTKGIDLDPLKRTQARYFHLLKREAIFEGGYLEYGPDVG